MCTQGEYACSREVKSSHSSTGNANKQCYIRVKKQTFTIFISMFNLYSCREFQYACSREEKVFTQSTCIRPISSVVLKYIHNLHQHVVFLLGEVQ